MTRSLLTIMLCLALSATGISSGAMRFDEVDDYIEIAGDDSIQLTDKFSIGMWFKPNTLSSSNDYLLSKSYTTNGVGDSYAFLWEYVDDNVEFYADKYTGDNPRTGSSMPISSAEWHYIIYTYDKSQTTFSGYVDGVQVFSNTSKDFILLEDSNPLRIGARPEAGTTHFNGSIDEVLIYNDALTASEIQAMYASGGAWYPKDGLVSRWSMENNGVSTGQAHANGSTINDSFGSNDGTVNDGADSSMTLESSPVRQKRGRR